MTFHRRRKIIIVVLHFARTVVKILVGTVHLIQKDIVSMINPKVILMKIVFFAINHRRENENNSYLETYIVVSE